MPSQPHRPPQKEETFHQITNSCYSLFIMQALFHPPSPLTCHPSPSFHSPLLSPLLSPVTLPPHFTLLSCHLFPSFHSPLLSPFPLISLSSPVTSSLSCHPSPSFHSPLPSPLPSPVTLPPHFTLLSRHLFPLLSPLPSPVTSSPLPSPLPLSCHLFPSPVTLPSLSCPPSPSFHFPLLSPRLLSHHPSPSFHSPLLSPLRSPVTLHPHFTSLSCHPLPPLSSPPGHGPPFTIPSSVVLDSMYRDLNVRIHAPQDDRYKQRSECKQAHFQKK